MSTDLTLVLLIPSSAPPFPTSSSSTTATTTTTKCVVVCLCVCALVPSSQQPRPTTRGDVSIHHTRLQTPPEPTPVNPRNSSNQLPVSFLNLNRAERKFFFVLMKDMPDSRHSHRTRCKPVPPPYTSDASKRKTLIVCTTIHETKTKHRYSRSLTLCFHRRSKTDGVLFKHSSLSVECGV